MIEYKTADDACHAFRPTAIKVAWHWSIKLETSSRLLGYYQYALKYVCVYNYNISV